MPDAAHRAGWTWDDRPVAIADTSTPAVAGLTAGELRLERVRVLDAEWSGRLNRVDADRRLAELDAALRPDDAGELEPCNACSRQVYDARQVELTVDGLRVGTWRLCPDCAGELEQLAHTFVDGVTPAPAIPLHRAPESPSKPLRRCDRV